tara:strand:+ start:1817 stop:3220 length:1404 start_codon:yes stop_codon:yes gene_type:complete
LSIYIEYLILIVTFFSPAVLLSRRIFKGKNKTLLLLITPVIGSFFWILSSIVLPMNYLIFNRYASFSLILITILIIFVQDDKWTQYRNLLILSLSLFMFEILNEKFGIITVVQTTSYAIESARLNLDMQYSRIPIPPVQIAGLKFINSNVILLTINQFVGLFLYIFNIEFISNYFKIKRVKLYLTSLPVLTIFCVLLEVSSGRTHFIASQILVLLLLLSIVECEQSTDFNNLYLLGIYILITSRIESVFLYGPLLLFVTIRYLDRSTIEIRKIILVFTSGILTNLMATSSISDLRSSIYLNIIISLLFISFLIYRKEKIVNLLIIKMNLLLSLLIFFLGCISYFLYKDLALNSWSLIVTHLLDTHQNWVLSTLLLFSIVVFCMTHTENRFIQEVTLHLFLVAGLILITSPFHHSIYGGTNWADGVIEMAIYNPYDESQTRSILQLLLSLTPISGIVMNSSKESLVKN